MKTSCEEGYIMASALAALFAMALVAAALVSVSGTALGRVKRMETAAHDRAAVESAIQIVGSQLAMDPRRRQMDFADGAVMVEIEGQAVSAVVSWESTRMDINGAPADEIESALTARRISLPARTEVLGKIRAAHARGTPLSLIDDLDLAPQLLPCASEHLTTFGGRTEFAEDEAQGVFPVIGRPAAGARIRIDASPVRGGVGRTAVLLMTGDVYDPYLVLDWREYRGGGDDACITDS